MMRTIFIGDIHGCYEEFLQLLEKVQYNASEDQLISVGDLVNKGPLPEKVLEWFYHHENAIALLGNHELALMHDLKSDDISYKESRKLIKKTSIPKVELLHWLEKMPSVLEGENWIAVHAGLDPWKDSISDNDRRTLCLSRYWNHKTKVMHPKLKKDDDPQEFLPWMDLLPQNSYGNKNIIYGHWAQKGLYRQGRFWGLDTGCCYGGKLTALLVPNWDLVQVESQQRKMFDY